jgi:hypothetical protein
MDNSFREQRSGTQQDPKRFWVSLTILASIVHWLVGLINLPEEEHEDAGIYLDRPGGE